VIPLSSIIQQVFSDCTEEFISTFNPSYAALKVLNHIVTCRTPALGAAVYECDCGERSFVYHSCRDRHCPVCQGISNARWAEKQMASSLPIKYFHVVFTLPDTLSAFILAHQREAYNALFESASSSLLKLCANPRHLGATPGFTAVLHTWGQTMQFHPHLHVIITAGGLSMDGVRFINKSDPNYLLPVKVLSKLFRGIFIDTLDKNTLLPLDLKSSLYQSEFFCYLKEPLDRSDNVVKYLARYANRVCISDYRIISYDEIGKTVTFSYKDNKDGGKKKIMVLSAIEFMRRFLLHVLPKRFMKIRHYGLLRNRGKFGRIKRCRRLLSSDEHEPLPCMPKIRVPSKCQKCGRPLTLSGHISASVLPLVLRC
jgi:hypothetical protein